MAKFTLSNDSVFSIGGNGITCITTVNIDEAVDVYISACRDSNEYRAQVPGGIVVTGTLEFEFEPDGSTQLGYIAPRASGALVFQPNGTTAGDLDITSTNITITGRSLNTSSTALSTGVASFACDDLTIGTN